MGNGGEGKKGNKGEEIKKRGEKTDEDGGTGKKREELLCKRM